MKGIRPLIALLSIEIIQVYVPGHKAFVTNALEIHDLKNTLTEMILMSLSTLCRGYIVTGS